MEAERRSKACFDYAEAHPYIRPAGANIVKVERRANGLARFAMPRRILYSPKVKYSESRAQSKRACTICYAETHPVFADKANIMKGVGNGNKLVLIAVVSNGSRLRLGMIRASFDSLSVFTAFAGTNSGSCSRFLAVFLFPVAEKPLY